MRKPILVTIFFLSFVIIAEQSSVQNKDDAKTEPKPIQITDQATQAEMQTAYNAIVMANKDFQIAILKAKVKYKVPEDWEFDASSLSFKPPRKP